MVGSIMERPSGPLGAATQSTGRPMVEIPISRPAPPANAFRRAPPNSVRPAGSNSSLSSQVPRSEGQVIALAREAMKNAIEENKNKAAEASGVSNELKPGVTIDLSHKQIQRFPDEVVDIIKNELERLALSHNQISAFPLRFSECASLRYLNVRNNVIRDFPLPICQLSSLEILDLGRNKLRTLPPDLAKLISLKVLSVQKNRIEELPLCLGEMASLVALKLEGNPIRFPLKELLQPQGMGPPYGAQENENDDVAITSQIKKFLRQKAISERSETESGGEESSEGTETPRPIKRVMSGRFPIKINGTEVPDLRSPGLPRLPPIPSRSHYRGLSQQNAALRRPGVMPLTMGNPNERLRSNSEGVVHARGDRSSSSDRSRRMGIVSKKASELGTVEETKVNNRFSHYRGLSHGSAMQGASNGVNESSQSRSPASPADSSQRATYVRRLSSLPERKRGSVNPDPVIEGAKGVLYALFQVHPLIQNLLRLARDSTNKRTSLERVFYNATSHVEVLDQDIQNYDTYSEEDEETAPRSNENVHQACMACVNAYIHVCSLLSRNVETLITNGDPCYIRTLLLLVYGSLAEIRNAGASLFSQGQAKSTRMLQSNAEARRLQPRDKSVTLTRDRPGTAGSRSRGATFIPNGGNSRVAIDSPQFMNGRSATLTSATPRSGESFASSNTSGSIMGSGDFSDEDRLFEQIFLRLQKSSDMAVKTLPLVNSHFVTTMRIGSQQGNPDQPRQFWQVLIQKCTIALQAADSLKARLSLIKLKEPGIRTQRAFWELCNAFVDAYTDLVIKVKEAKTVTNLFPTDVIALLRPLQKAIKEAGQLIQTSPWSFLAARQAPNGGGSNGAFGLQSPASQVPLPMTPHSAALGPAVQATVPSTPQSASFGAMFAGNVFERADALLSMSGTSSVASSRAGTMTSSFSSNDGAITPASLLSPLSSMNSRYNAGGKVSF